MKNKPIQFLNRQYQKPFTLTATLLLIILTAISVAQDFPFEAITAASVLTWLVCWILFTLADLLAGPIEKGLWAGYLYLATTVAWLTLGWTAAWVMILAGCLVATGLRWRGVPNLSIKPTPLRASGELMLSRYTISGIALLGAAGIYTLAGGTFPSPDDAAGILRVASALLAGFALTQIVGALLQSGQITGYHLEFVTWRQRLSGELLLLLTVIPLVHLRETAGVLAFTILMGMVAAQALRYRQVHITQSSLTHRVRELSLLNTIGGNISIKLVLDDVFQSIYDCIQEVMDVSLFYIALCEERGDVVEFAFVMQDNRRITWENQRVENIPPIKHIVETQSMLNVPRTDDNRFGAIFATLPDAPRHQCYLGFPLATGARRLGVLGIISGQDHPQDTRLFETLEAIVNQAGLAIGNALLYERSVRLVDNLTRINRSMRGILFNDDAGTMRAACETAMTITRSQKAAIFRTDDEEEGHVNLVEAIGITDEHRRLYAELTYKSRGKQKLLVISDIATLAADDALTHLAKAGNFQAMAEIALKSGDTLAGLLAVFHDQPHYYDSTELELLDTLAYQVAATLDNVALLDALEAYASEQAQLVQLSRISTSSLDLKTAINRVTEVLPLMMETDQIHIGLLEANRDQIQLYAEDGNPSRLFYVDDVPEVATFMRQPQPTPRIYNRKDSVVSEGLVELMGAEISLLAVVPLIADQELLGVILLGNTDSREFPESEWRRIEMAANQIAAQFHNVQLYSSTQKALNRRMQQLILIENIAQQISGALDLDQVMRNVLEAAIQATRAEVAALSIRTETGELNVRTVEYLGNEWVERRIIRDPAIGVMGRVLRTGETLLIPDNRAMPEYLPDLAEQTYLSSVVVPLIQEDRIVGALDVESSQLNFFRDEQIAFMKSLAGHAVISIQNARLLQQHQNQIETLIWLRDLSLRLSSDTEMQSVVAAVLETSLGILQGSSAALYRYYEETDGLILIGGMSDYDGTYVPAQVFIPEAIVYQAIHSGKIQVIEDVQKSDYFRDADFTGRSRYASLIVTPIKHGNRVLEVLCVTSLVPHRYSTPDLNTVELLASQAAGHLENVRLYERIHTASGRMRAILDSTREGIILLDPSGRLIEANASAENLLNIDMAEHIGQNFVEFLMTHLSEKFDAQDTPTHDSLTDMARVLRLEPERITRRSLEIVRDGKLHYIEEVGSPVTTVRGQILGRLLTLRDVTEERMLAAYRDEISSMVVHDLRGPLGSIISSHILMQEIVDELGDETLPQLLQVSLDSATSLMNLVDSLLEIAKLETRRMPINRTAVAIPDLVDSAYAALASSTQEAQITVEQDIAAGLPKVDVDGDKIRRVIINVLDNALRFTPAGGQVLIEAATTGRKVLVRISDGGPGIPPEERERVFEKFRQIKDSNPVRGRKGMGLGLTFCKLAVEAHGETIWVDKSASLPGASFNFTLPIAPDSPEEGK